MKISRKVRNTLGWVLWTALAVLIVLLGYLLLNTDGQLVALWAFVALTLIPISIRIAKLESKRYRKRDSEQNKKLLEDLPKPKPKSPEQEEIDKKYQEFHDKPTPEEHHLQHLRMVLLGSMLAITILQKGPKAIFMLSELLK